MSLPILFRSSLSCRGHPDLFKTGLFLFFFVSLFSIWLLCACKNGYNQEYTVKKYTVCRHVTDLKQQTVKQPSFLCNSSSEFASGSSDLSTRTISSKWIYCLKVSGHTPHTNTHMWVTGLQTAVS